MLCKELIEKSLDQSKTNEAILKQGELRGKVSL
jgi:hypothetical protein